MLPSTRVSFAACGLVLFALAAGCAKHTTRPPITDIRLTLDVTPETGDPSHPVTVDAKVLNAGDTRMWHCEGCGCGNGIGLVVLGPDGEKVELVDPNGQRPMCADGSAALEPGGHLDARIVFTGTLYARGYPLVPSPTYPAPPGTYTVVSGFRCGQQWMAGDEVSVGQRTTFVWQP